MENREELIENAEKAIQELMASGIPENNIIRQFEIFREGLPFQNILKPAKIGDGIIRINEIERADLIQYFNKGAAENRYSKFVPASGAATRMFKALHSVAGKYSSLSLDELKKLTDKDSATTLRFVTEISSFAFCRELFDKLKEYGYSPDPDYHASDIIPLLKFTLGQPGLNYSTYPKGYVQFHKYPDGPKTAFEEQISEALVYALNSNGTLKIHFTLPSEHLTKLAELINNLKSKYETARIKILTDYSVQKESTHTIAATPDNRPFLEGEYEFHLRPAGHGALLENLNDINADIVFIKNIDNVVHEDHREATGLYKKLLAGYLIKTEEKIHEILGRIESGDYDSDFLNNAINFVSSSVNILVDEKIRSADSDAKARFLTISLNRPLRVCGMVKNEGQAGGGPFWVKDQDGKISLQIVEEAQINKDIEDQYQKFISATHFNPVDLVCSVRNYKGENFDLRDYRDLKTGFITVKSKNGTELKAYELPGLWNGSMAFWNTIFIEVPKETFSPVKEVTDLLSGLHQPFSNKGE